MGPQLFQKTKSLNNLVFHLLSCYNSIFMQPTTAYLMLPTYVVGQIHKVL